MAKKNFIDDISVNTIVGPGALISGFGECRRNCAGGYYCAGLRYHSFIGNGDRIGSDKKTAGRR